VLGTGEAGGSNGALEIAEWGARRGLALAGRRGRSSHPDDVNGGETGTGKVVMVLKRTKSSRLSSPAKGPGPEEVFKKVLAAGTMLLRRWDGHGYARTQP